MNYHILQDQIIDVLDTLMERERRVLELRFGLKDGRSRTLEEVDPDTVASALGEGGIFSRTFPGYEHRPQQVEMARAVTER